MCVCVITCNMFACDGPLALLNRWQLTKYDYNNKKKNAYLLIFIEKYHNWKTNKCGKIKTKA